MIKLIGCARRLPHLSREEFDSHWRDRHAPLVRSFAEVLRIRRYVQTSTLDQLVMQESIRTSRGAMEATFDGYAELWWDSFDDVLAVRQTEDGQKALRMLLDDERRFVDSARSQFWYGTERAIIPPEV